MGIFEYISSYRRLPLVRLDSVTLGGFSVDVEKQRRFYDSESKFNDLKHYLALLYFEDLQELNRTGQMGEKLSEIREIFNSFFAPKQFVGVHVQADQTPPISFPVSTPSGEHDIDNLSSGEKEVFMVFTNLHRLKLANSVLLYEEPELHLHASLERKMMEHLKRLKGTNQIWVTTHALEIIGSVDPSELFHLEFYKGNNQVKTVSQEREKIQVFENLGASVGIQLVSEKVVFVEGESDKQVLETLFNEHRHRISFIPTGGVGTLTTLSQRVNDLLREASKYSEFYMIRDRDFLSQDEMRQMEEEHHRRMHVWSHRQIENFFLVPSVIFRVLRRLNISTFASEVEIEAELKRLGDERKDQTIAEWVAYELTREIRKVNLAVDGENSDLQTLLERALTVRSRVENVFNENSVRAQVKEKTEAIRYRWNSGDWRELISGRKLLKRFVATHVPGVRHEQFFHLLIAEMKESESIPDEFKNVIGEILSSKEEYGKAEKSLLSCAEKE